MVLRYEVYYSIGNFHLLLGHKLACVSNSYEGICKLAITRTAISTMRMKIFPVIIGSDWWLILAFPTHLPTSIKRKNLFSLTYNCLFQRHRAFAWTFGALVCGKILLVSCNPQLAKLSGVKLSASMANGVRGLDGLWGWHLAGLGLEARWGRRTWLP